MGAAVSRSLFRAHWLLLGAFNRLIGCRYRLEVVTEQEAAIGLQAESDVTEHEIAEQSIYHQDPLMISPLLNALEIQILKGPSL